MNRDFMIKFNFTTNIILLVLLVSGSFAWADTNGVWTYAGDIVGGIVGSDQQVPNMNFSFINPVYAYNSLVGKSGSQNGYLTSNGLSGISNDSTGSAIYGLAQNGAYSGYFENGVFEINQYQGKNLTFANGNLKVSGNIDVGRQHYSSGFGTNQMGSRLNFGGAPLNTDPLYMQRYDISPDRTVLRAMIGDNYKQQGAVDYFVVGATLNPSASVHSVFNVSSGGNANIEGNLAANGNIKSSGKVMSPKYCDESGNNCISAANLVSGGGGGGATLTVTVSVNDGGAGLGETHCPSEYAMTGIKVVNNVMTLWCNKL